MTGPSESHEVDLCVRILGRESGERVFCKQPPEAGVHQPNNPYGHQFRPLVKKVVRSVEKPPSASTYVREFHETYSQPIRTVPRADIPPEQIALRLDLIEEETKELKDAIEAGDIVEIADALGDLLYVTYGAGLFFGVDLDAVVKEIHRSNMSKLDEDGKPIYRPDGKVLKGPNYFKPDIRRVLGLDD